jgi:hypothetical protein
LEKFPAESMRMLGPSSGFKMTFFSGNILPTNSC